MISELCFINIIMIPFFDNFIQKTADIQKENGKKKVQKY